MDEPTVPCPCCGGTGVVVKRGVGSGQSEMALLRSELIRVWDIAGSLEGLAAGIYETAGEVISSLAADLENAGSGIAERDRLISDLERQLAVHQGWDGDAPDEDQGEEPGKAPGKKDGQPAMTRDEHRLASARFEAARSGGDPDLITKKKRGAQSGHRGVSRRERTEGTVRFPSRTVRVLRQGRPGDHQYHPEEVPGPGRGPAEHHLADVRDPRGAVSRVRCPDYPAHRRHPRDVPGAAHARHPPGLREGPQHRGRHGDDATGDRGRGCLGGGRLQLYHGDGRPHRRGRAIHPPRGARHTGPGRPPRVPLPGGPAIRHTRHRVPPARTPFSRSAPTCGHRSSPSPPWSR